MSIFSVKDLAIGYDGNVVADKITFDVNEKDYICVVGENGAGKSTLIKTLLGLQKPISGTIENNEKGIGYLPQQTVVQKDFPASVWEVVISGNLAKLGKRIFYNVQDKKNARENMEKMGIWDIRKKCYRHLSGGQQQRVLLARALCASSKLLVLDEPVTGLDPQATLDFYKLIQSLNESGMTIMMISHDITASVKYASHILYIGKKEMFFGTVDEYRKSDLAKHLGFGLEE